MEIILKNITQSVIKINDLGIIITPNQESISSYSNVDSFKYSSELRLFIESGDIVVNNGLSDLSINDALKFLGFIEEEKEYYTKPETNILIQETNNNITQATSNLTNVYYSKEQVDYKIANIQASGIKGAVSLYTQLPQIDNSVGDIYIVRESTPYGTQGQTAFIPTGTTGAYFPFDTTWQDSLGHTGTASGTFSFTNGKIDRAIDFNNNKSLTFNSHPDFGQQSSLTVGGWLYTRREGTYGIIGRWSNDDDGEGWKIEVHGNKLRIHLDTPYAWDGGANITDSVNLEINTWVHVAFVFGSRYVALYKNGILINGAVMPPGNIDSNNLPLTIGKGWNNDSAQFLDGLMDDWFIENRAMSSDELEHLVYGEVESYHYEGFYRWDGEEWEFLSRNTGEDGTTVIHNDILGLNDGDYQHLTMDEKSQLFFGNTTDVHNHNDQYYTKQETENNFSNKTHLHDDRYYTKGQIDSLGTQVTYATISANDPSTNITSVELETLTNGSNADSLHTHDISNSISGQGLNEAYNGHNSNGRWGEGRIINIDYGPVELRAQDGYAPFKLQEINYTPNQSLAGGEICFKDNEIWFRDAVREKFVSMSFIACQFSSNSNGASGYAYYGNAQCNSSNGFSMPWSGVIVGISGTCQNSANARVDIRKNGDTEKSLWWQSTKIDVNNLNINFGINDTIQINFDSNNTKPNKPCITLYIRKRL